MDNSWSRFSYFSKIPLINVFDLINKKYGLDRKIMSKNHNYH